MDPERLRLLGLIGALLLVLLVFGGIYWRAVMAPGAGASLPRVPMPPLNAAATSTGQLITAASGAGAPPSPEAGLPMDPDERGDIERRLARAEQDLAQAQQAIQAQQQNIRQPERLPVLAAPDNSDIKIARSSQPPKLDPALAEGFQALNGGDLTRAQQQYEAALRQDPNNRDALLGLAAVAVKQDRGQQAAATYLRLLELDPGDTTAVSGLISLRQGDAGQSELRLKNILAQSPDAAPVLFALGNLYARQGRWSEAQQTFFRAYGAAPDNADYAFNLAVGLDRLNQGKLALTYYQRALALAQNGASAFDRNALRKRMQELGGGAGEH